MNCWYAGVIIMDKKIPKRLAPEKHHYNAHGHPN